MLLNKTAGVKHWLLVIYSKVQYLIVVELSAERKKNSKWFAKNT